MKLVFLILDPMTGLFEFLPEEPPDLVVSISIDLERSCWTEDDRPWRQPIPFGQVRADPKRGPGSVLAICDQDNLSQLNRVLKGIQAS